jgi:hypothetical protein
VPRAPFLASFARSGDFLSSATPTPKTAPTAARTSPTGPSNNFRARYYAPSITKWDIFHYIYGVLHHPEYRERYAANLPRELPRILFASVTTACHPDEAESPASPGTPEEGPVHLVGTTDATDKYIGPSARKERGPQDDKGVHLEKQSPFVSITYLHLIPQTPTKPPICTIRWI